MGQEYNEDYVRIRHRNDFSNKLFSAWDYHITNKNVAHFKHKAMKKHFEVYKLQNKYKLLYSSSLTSCTIQDEVWCSEERNTKRNVKEWIIILTIRFFINLFVFLCLAGAGAAIYFTIRLSLERVSCYNLMAISYI